MADRLKSLRRIEAVQGEMVKLAECRLADAARRVRALGEDRARLVDFVGGTGALGVPLARAALRSVEALDRRIAAAEQDHAGQKARLDALRRRDRAVGTMVDAAARDARRAAEAGDLAATLEAWLARTGSP